MQNQTAKNQGMPNHATQAAGKILVVDADTASSMKLAGAFLRRGWPILSAGDAMQAQSLARKENPVAMVLSSFLPGGSAGVVVKRIRTSAYTVTIPVIVFRKEGGSSKEEVIAAGATEYFEDCDPAALCESLERHLGSSPSAVVQAPILQAPPDVIARPQRMQALDAADVLDTSPSRLQDSITRAAALILGVPVTLLSIVDQDRQFFKSQVGLPEPWASQRQTPLSHSFCQWVVSSEEDLIVKDAQEMPGLKPNLAIRDLGVIAYAGIPVRAANREVLGSFCAIESKPRDWDRADLANLRNLARMAEAALVMEAVSGSAGTRSQASLTFMLNAVQLLRRGHMQSANEAQSLLLQLLEDENRNLLRMAG